MEDRHVSHGNTEDGEKHATTRRNFLRRVGITGAAAAALMGGADLVGLTPAYARSRKALAGTHGGPDINCLCSYECSYTPGECGNCGTGNCCFSCTSNCGNFKQCNNCDKRPSYAGCE